jgi:hypothetical protein
VEGGGENAKVPLSWSSEIFAIATIFALPGLSFGTRKAKEWQGPSIMAKTFRMLVLHLLPLKNQVTLGGAAFSFNPSAYSDEPKVGPRLG